MTTNVHACRHAKPPDLGYMEAHSDADRRRKKGEGQRLCLNCGKYIWVSLFRTSEIKRETK